MPRIIRKKDKSQGHTGHCYWKPILPSVLMNTRVFAQGPAEDNFLVVVKNDTYVSHECSHNKHKHKHPNPKATGASSKVKIGGIGVHRDGDGISCGDAADNGATRVFVDGGGTPGATEILGDPGETVGYVVGTAIVTVASNIKFAYEYTTATKSRGDPPIPTKVAVFSKGIKAEYGFTAITPIYQETKSGGKSKMYWPNYPSNHPDVIAKKVEAGANLPEDAPDSYRKPIPITVPKIFAKKPNPLPDPGFLPVPRLGAGLKWKEDTAGNIVGVEGTLIALPAASDWPVPPAHINSVFLVTAVPGVPGGSGLEGEGKITITYSGRKV